MPSFGKRPDQCVERIPQDEEPTEFVVGDPSDKRSILGRLVVHDPNSPSSLQANTSFLDRITRRKKPNRGTIIDGELVDAVKIAYEKAQKEWDQVEKRRNKALKIQTAESEKVRQAQEKASKNAQKQADQAAKKAKEEQEKAIKNARKAKPVAEKKAAPIEPQTEKSKAVNKTEPKPQPPARQKIYPNQEADPPPENKEKVKYGAVTHADPSSAINLSPKEMNRLEKEEKKRKANRHPRQVKSPETQISALKVTIILTALLAFSILALPFLPKYGNIQSADVNPLNANSHFERRPSTNSRQNLTGNPQLTDGIDFESFRLRPESCLTIIPLNTTDPGTASARAKQYHELFPGTQIAIVWNFDKNKKRQYLVCMLITKTPTPQP